MARQGYKGVNFKEEDYEKILEGAKHYAKKTGVTVSPAAYINKLVAEDKEQREDDSENSQKSNPSE